jgi:hypothetical protein
MNYKEAPTEYILYRYIIPILDVSVVLTGFGHTKQNQALVIVLHNLTLVMLSQYDMSLQLPSD